MRFILACLFLVASAQAQFMPFGFWKSGAAAPAWSAWSIDSIYAYYRSDSLGVAKNDNDTTYVWMDRLPGARHLYATNKPKLRTDSLAGYPTVVTDGADDYMRASGWTLAQPNTYFLVVKNHKILGTGNGYFLDGVASSGRAALLNYIAASNNISLFAGVPLPSLAFPLDADSARVITVQFNGARSLLRINGKTYMDAATGTQTATGITVSEAWDNSQGSLGASWYEIIVSDALLTPSEITTIETALLTKYGLPSY